MEKINAAAGPTRLYALLLRLRPLQQGTLMPFSGELVHGAFLKWLRAAAPDVVEWLHEGQKRRLFTCSSLQFPGPLQAHLKAERENIHLPLDPQKTYTVRLTLLLGELFPLFYNALMQFNVAQMGSASPPFMQFGKQLFLLEEILLGKDDPTGWTGFTSLSALVEQARSGNPSSLTFEFASLTTFNRGNHKYGYGSYPVMLPIPLYIFQNLLKRWEDVAPPELTHVIEPESLERYLEEEGVIITDYDLIPHHVNFTTHIQRGFIGTCSYQLRGHPQKTSPEAPLTLQQQLHVLSQLAFYTGIGYKTAMGLGRMRLKA